MSRASSHLWERALDPARSAENTNSALQHSTQVQEMGVIGALAVLLEAPFLCGAHDPIATCCSVRPGRAAAETAAPSLEGRALALSNPSRSQDLLVRQWSIVRGFERS